MPQSDAGTPLTFNRRLLVVPRLLSKYNHEDQTYQYCCQTATTMLKPRHMKTHVEQGVPYQQTP